MGAIGVIKSLCSSAPLWGSSPFSIGTWFSTFYKSSEMRFFDCCNLSLLCCSLGNCYQHNKFLHWSSVKAAAGRIGFINLISTLVHNVIAESDVACLLKAPLLLWISNWKIKYVLYLLRSPNRWPMIRIQGRYICHRLRAESLCTWQNCWLDKKDWFLFISSLPPVSANPAI